VEVDPDAIPLDDPKTYELYQRGETVATFQFESDGMRKHLKALKPTNIEDLIAMNALYRPGPMDNIPSFIRRKHGQEPVVYPHPLLEPILRNTYGIMVYQEQIMEAAKVLAGYTLGGADLLRRAMGKKKVEEMAKERAKFLEGTRKNGIADDKANEIFDLMEKFAGYGFNKSHAAAYSILAFRTAYLKANYPHEYMAAVLSHNLSNIEKISFFIEETKAMGIDVLPPCVNESRLLFSVNDQGHLRFGLGAIKGVGEAVAQGIVEERLANGPYASLFDLAARLDKQLLNRRTLESLAYAGALDACSGAHIHRAQFFAPLASDAQRTVLDLATQYGARVQENKNSNQAALFGGGGAAQESIPEPDIPRTDPWPDLVKLNYEREVIGFYLSGHPMDRFELEINAFCNTKLDELPDRRGRDVTFAGIVTGAKERVSKTGSRFGTYTLEDKTGKTECMLFKDQFANFKSYLELNNIVFVRGKLEPSYRDPSQHELRIVDVKMMEGLLEAQARRLELQLMLDQVQPTFIQQLANVLAQHKGKIPLRFVVVSDSQPKPLAFSSRNTLVAPSHELIRALRALHIGCKLG
jgi:DNA polymerase-3 subunit alpha